MHLSSGYPVCLGLASVEEVGEGAFPWVRLPKEIQHDILRNALLPSELGSTALVIGKPSHRAHMHSVAIPILLGLSNWEAYTDAAQILYAQVDLVLLQTPDAAMYFLTSPTTLHPRRLVARLQIRMDIEHDLCMFDEGWRSTASAPEARVNIPTALHSMRIHGRLREVHFLLSVPEIIYHRDPDPTTGKERTMSTYYLPMARLQLAHWEAAVWDSPGACSAPASTPGREVIAPAFLAGRAFQYGFIPLFEAGVMEKSTLRLEVVSRTAKSRVEGTDAERLFKYWLGATIVEVLGELKAIKIARGKWIDPFAIARRMSNDGQTHTLGQSEADNVHEPAVLVDNDSDDEIFDTNTLEPEAYYSATHALTHHELMGYKSRGDDLLLSSPIKYDSPTPSSVSPTEDVTMDLDAYVQEEAAEDEAMVECRVDQALEMDVALQPDGYDDEHDITIPFLEASMSSVVASDVMESVENSQTRALLSRSFPSSEDDADSDSSDDQGTPLRVTEGLGYSKPAVTSSDSSSSSDSTTSNDECPPSRSIAFKSERPAISEHKGSTPSFAPQASDEVDCESRTSSSFDDSAPEPPAPEIPPYLSRTQSNNTVPLQDYDDSSALDSSSDSSSSDDEEDRNPCNKPTLAAENPTISTARREEGVAFATRRGHMATPPLEKGKTRGRSTSRTLASNTPTTVFHPVNPQVPTFPHIPAINPPRQLAYSNARGVAAIGQKRQAPCDGSEPNKMSKNARRRANRRARSMARTGAKTL